MFMFDDNLNVKMSRYKHTASYKLQTHMSFRDLGTENRLKQAMILASCKVINFSFLVRCYPMVLPHYNRSMLSFRITQ